jgi:hypothetical protein
MNLLSGKGDWTGTRNHQIGRLARRKQRFGLAAQDVRFQPASRSSIRAACLAKRRTISQTGAAGVKLFRDRARSPRVPVASAPPAQPAEEEVLADTEHAEQDAKEGEGPGMVGTGDTAEIDAEQARKKR